MSINRYAARIDANKLAIVDALRAAGCTVYDAKQPVDLIVGGDDRWTLLLEIKNPKQPPSKRKHTKAQAAFLATWRGGPVVTVMDVEGALRAVALMRI